LQFGRLKAGLFHVAYVANNSRLFSIARVYCRRLRATYMRHMADDPIYRKPTRPLRTYTESEWARMPPAWRDAHNKLRRLQYLPRIDEPAVDLSPKPDVPPRKLFDGPNELAHAIARGDDPKGDLWQELKAAAESLLAAADGDTRALEERLREGVATPEECRLATDLRKGKVCVEGEIRDARPAHRPKTLRRGLEGDVAARLLRVWDGLAPRKRKSQRTVLREIKNAYGISRSQALKILKTIREREKRQPATGE
jgi:hypothetical protein